MIAFLFYLLFSTGLPLQQEPLPGTGRDQLLKYWQGRGKEARVQTPGGKNAGLVVESGQGASLMRRTYLFDEKGRCTEMQVESGCVSCLEELLRDILTLPEHGWQKLNENQYISRFESRLLLEIPPGTSLKTVVLLYADWTPEAYELLRKNR